MSDSVRTRSERAVRKVPREMPRAHIVTSQDGGLRPRVDRARLRALLDRSAAATVVLVRAPAGYGKTALLESWVEGRSRSGDVVWESIAPGDDDPRRFWSRFIAGIRGRSDERTRRRLGRIRLTPQGLTDGLSASLARILLGVTEPLVIVLDDFEHITDPAISKQLEGLIASLSTRIRLVISSRTDPALHLHRMMVEGRAASLGVEDLAFDLDEAAQLLDAHGIRLSEKCLDVAMQRTEGWPAGLRLLGITLERHLAPEDAVLAFNGEDRLVSRYISEEIFESLDDEMKSFLLQIGVVDQLSSSNANSLTGRGDSDRMLDVLSRSNALIANADNHGIVFRIHPLFADFLRAELHRSDPSLAHEQHRKAAELSGAAGAFEGVLAQAIAASDARLAEDFLSAGSFLDLFGRSEVVIDSRLWHLPNSDSDGDPLLVLADAARSLAIGDIDGSTMRLEEAAQLIDAETISDAYRARVVLTICQGIHAAMSGDDDRMLDAVEQLEAIAGRATQEGFLLVPDLRSIVETFRGASLLMAGKWHEADSLLSAGLVSSRRAGRPFFELVCISLLAASAAGRGRPSTAHDRGQEAVALAREYGLSHSPALVGAHLALAWAYYQRDQLEDADESLADARRNQGAFHKSPPFAVGLALLGASVASARGDFSSGLALLEGTYDLGAEWSPFQEQQLAYLRAEVLLQSGEIEGAAAALDGREPTSLSESATLAQALLAQRNATAALDVMEVALASPDPDDVVGHVRIWCVKARALESSGDSKGAVRATERALALAEAEEIKRVFLTQGREMRDLLHNVLRASIGPRTFARTLFEGLKAPANQPTNSTLIDPLTERELNVLRYLPSLLSAGEIAAEMYISLNTVKTHLRSIYRKLGVSTRRGAVDRATELNLL
jgi:LuxR family transcriptional regulator, maltose regulon positive regulatory protein